MRRLGLVAGVAIIAAVLVGCTATYQVNNLAGQSMARLDRSRVVYVTIPQDGAYGDKSYPGSGQLVAQSVAAAFSSRASSVHIADRQMTSAEALAAAKSLKADYVVVPLIAHWEQRATAWSGIPSRMAVRVTIFDAQSGAQLTSNAIEGSSASFTMASTTPQALLRVPLETYVTALYDTAP